MARSRIPVIPTIWNPWQRGAALAGLILIVTYPVTVALERKADASTLSGMLFGTLATLLMAGAALYGVRRRALRRGPGRSRTWQQFHLYGGALFLLLTLLHTAFRIPQGAMTRWLLGLSLWVFLSGVLGLLIQQWLQRLLRPLRVEVLYERIPELVDQLRTRAEELAAASSAPVRELHREAIAPVLVGPRNDLRCFLRPVPEGTPAARRCELLLKVTEGEDRERVEALAETVRTKLELDAHYTLQKGLRWWLYIHVPPSIALLVLVAAHIVVVFSY